jgi:hypothetical protein
MSLRLRFYRRLIVYALKSHEIIKNRSPLFAVKCDFRLQNLTCKLCLTVDRNRKEIIS